MTSFRLRGVRGPLQRDRRIGAVATVGAAGGYGLVAGWWTTRGPITTSEALAAIAIGLVIGAIAGLVLRTRWAVLLAPVTFVIAFEVSRIGTTGPLVDGIHLGSTYGTIAFVLGRGIHGILALLSMLLGAALGAAAARRLNADSLHADASARHGWARAGLWTRRSVTALVSLGLVALTVAIIRPARTDPILAADGQPLAGSVAERGSASAATTYP